MSTPIYSQSGLIWSHLQFLHQGHTAGKRTSLDDKELLRGWADVTRLRLPLPPSLGSPFLCSGSRHGIWGWALLLLGPMEDTIPICHLPSSPCFSTEVTQCNSWPRVGLELLSGTWGDTPGNSRVRVGSVTNSKQGVLGATEAEWMLCGNERQMSHVTCRTSHLP